MKPRKNVLFIYRRAPIPSNGGTENVMFNLITAFRESNEINIYSCSTDSGKELYNHFYISEENLIADLEEKIINLGIDFIVLHSTLDFTFIKYMAEIKRKFPSIIIIIHHHAIISKFKHLPSETIDAIKNSNGIKKLIKIVFFVPYTIRIGRYITHIHNFTYENSDRYVLLSKYFIDDLQRLLWWKKIDRTKAISITNPYCFSTQKYESYTKEKTVLFVGRINYRDKNIGELLEIWKRIKNDWTLEMIGDGPDFERLKQDIKRLGLNNIILKGAISNRQELFDEYKKASLLFLTSEEGWGLVLIEAMEFGCIPILYNLYSSAKEIVENGKNGFLIRSGNRKQFVKVATDLMDGKITNLEEIRQNAYSYIQRFSIDKTVHKWISLFREVENGK